MKLVLLPGMDGTGRLFSPLLDELSQFDCEIIPLPDQGDQDYASITAHVKGRLPREDFILVAESFSGPVGAALAMEGIENLKGIIFVATFLSPLNEILLRIARYLPFKFLSSLPFANYFYKRLFLGAGANDELLRLFQSIMSAMPPALIRARIKAMFSLKEFSGISDLPVSYIQASADKLVPSGKVREFERYFRNIDVRVVEGPHFIL